MKMTYEQKCAFDLLQIELSFLNEHSETFHFFSLFESKTDFLGSLSCATLNELEPALSDYLTHKIDFAAFRDIYDDTMSREMYRISANDFLNIMSINDFTPFYLQYASDSFFAQISVINMVDSAFIKLKSLIQDVYSDYPELKGRFEYGTQQCSDI